MNADRNELQERLAEADGLVGRMTNLMLRAVWQHIMRNRPSKIVSGEENSHALTTSSCRKFPAAQQSTRCKASVSVTHARCRSTLVDQATLSRELYRGAMDAARQQAEAAFALPVLGHIKEEEGIPSVSLLLLHTARQRAVMLLCLLRLRMAVFQQKLLSEECTVRYSYYLQRRVLRAWHTFAVAEYRRQQKILSDAVRHWVAFLEHRQGIRRFLYRFRTGLQERCRSLVAVYRRRKQQYFSRWRHRLNVRKLAKDLTERGEKVRRRRAYVNLSAANCRDPVFATRIAVFSHWKKKTERRLELKLAEFFCKRSQLRHVWSRLLGHFRRTSFKRRVPYHEVASQEAVVYVHPVTTDLMTFKSHCAQHIALISLKRAVFCKWRSLYHCRLSDRFFMYHRRLQVMELWLRSLRRKWVALFVKRECLLRWRTRFLYRLDGARASHWRYYRVLKMCLTRWQLLSTARHFQQRWVLRLCFRRWWHRIVTVLIARGLCVNIRRRSFLTWREAASRREHHRTMLCLAESLRELVLLLGCFRFWRRRFEDTCRVHLSESILDDLRREKRRARLFHRWKCLTFSLDITPCSVNESVD